MRRGEAVSPGDSGVKLRIDQDLQFRPFGRGEGTSPIQEFSHPLVLLLARTNLEEST